MRSMELSLIPLQVNSLEAALHSKGKSKDIHLPSIDVSFGSNRILCVHIHTS
jgi:ATP-binding cassette, subfamily F, member 3